MKTLSDVNLTNKVCLTRVDFNCPLDEDKIIQDYTRIKAHAETIKAISDRSGKCVLIAHQGRPGSTDFSSLAQHAKKLEDILSKEYSISFLPATHGKMVEERIKKLLPGGILVLDNVRQVEGETDNKSPEEHEKSEYIQSLLKEGDIFVNDAFSAAHRSHRSLVGFTASLPSVAGHIMEREVKNLQRVIENPIKPCIFILGGVKPEDSFKVADYVLNNNIADFVLTGGVISELLLIAMDKPLGEASMSFLSKKGLLKYLEPAQKLIMEYKDKVKAQIDFAVNENGRVTYSISDLPLKNAILDIGDETIAEYTELIRNSMTCVFNGPMGKFEESGFGKGTLDVFSAMSQSKGFSLAGGGHSISILEKNDIKLSYVSTAGGAMIQFLMGKPLPAIQALNQNADQFFD